MGRWLWNGMELGILSKLNFMRKNSILCDLKVETEDNVVIEMHRIVWLAAFVDYDSLKSQFAIKMDKLSNLYLPYVSGNMLKTIIDFIYGEKITVIPHGLQENLEKLGFSDWKNYLPETNVKSEFETVHVKQEPVDDIGESENPQGFLHTEENEKHSDITTSNTKTSCCDKDKSQNDYVMSDNSSERNVDLSLVKTESESLDGENQELDEYNQDEKRHGKRDTRAVHVPSFRISFVESSGNCHENEKDIDPMIDSHNKDETHQESTGNDSKENPQESPRKQPTILPKFSNDEAQVKTLATFSPVFEYVKNAKGQWIYESRKLLPVPLSHLETDLPHEQSKSEKKVLTTAECDTDFIKAIATDKDGKESKRYLVPSDVVHAAWKRVRKYDSGGPQKRGRKSNEHLQERGKQTLQEKLVTTSHCPVVIFPKTDIQACAINSSINVVSKSVQSSTTSVGSTESLKSAGQSGAKDALVQLTSHQGTVPGSTTMQTLTHLTSLQNTDVRQNIPVQNIKSVPIAFQNINNGINLCNVVNTAGASYIRPTNPVPCILQGNLAAPGSSFSASSNQLSCNTVSAIQPLPIPPSVGPIIQPVTVPLSACVGSTIQPLNNGPPSVSAGSTFQPLTLSSHINVGHTVQQMQISASTGVIQAPSHNLIELCAPKIISMGPKDFDTNANKGNAPLKTAISKCASDKTCKKKLKKPNGPVKLREIKPKPSGDASVCLLGTLNRSIEHLVGTEKTILHSKSQIEDSEDITSSVTSNKEKDHKYVIYDAVNDFADKNEKHVISMTSEEHKNDTKVKSEKYQRKGPHHRKSSDHDKSTLLTEPIEKFMSKFGKKIGTRKHVRKIKMEASQRKRRLDTAQSSKNPQRDSSGAPEGKNPQRISSGAAQGKNPKRNSSRASQGKGDDNCNVDVKVEVSHDSSFVTVFLDTGGSDEEDEMKNCHDVIDNSKPVHLSSESIDHGRMKLPLNIANYNT